MMPLPEAWRATSENSVNAKFAERDLELPSIGWQLFILGGSQTDSTAFLSSLDTYDTRLLTEPLTRSWVNNVGCSAEGSKRKTTRAQRRAGQSGYPRPRSTYLLYSWGCFSTEGCTFLSCRAGWRASSGGRLWEAE